MEKPFMLNQMAKQLGRQNKVHTGTSIPTSMEKKEKKKGYGWTSFAIDCFHEHASDLTKDYKQVKRNWRLCSQAFWSSLNSWHWNFFQLRKLTKLNEPKQTFSSTLVDDQLPHPVRNVEQKWPAWTERHVQCQPYNLQRQRSSSSSQCRGKSKVNCLFLRLFRSNFSIALPTAWNVTCATALPTHEDVVHTTDFLMFSMAFFTGIDGHYLCIYMRVREKAEAICLAPCTTSTKRKKGSA